MAYNNKPTKSRIPMRNASPARSRSVGKKRKISLRIKTGDEVLIRESKSDFPLERKNFLIMAAAAVLIVVGFMLMLGGSSIETEFNPDIFSTRRIVIGPTVAFLGFLLMGAAVIYMPRKRQQKVEADKNVES